MGCVAIAYAVVHVEVGVVASIVSSCSACCSSSASPCSPARTGSAGRRRGRPAALRVADDAPARRRAPALDAVREVVVAARPAAELGLVLVDRREHDRAVALARGQEVPRDEALDRVQPHDPALVDGGKPRERLASLVQSLRAVRARSASATSASRPRPSRAARRRSAGCRSRPSQSVASAARSHDAPPPPSPVAPPPRAAVEQEHLDGVLGRRPQPVELELERVPVARVERRALGPERGEARSPDVGAYEDAIGFDPSLGRSRRPESGARARSSAAARCSTRWARGERQRGARRGGGGARSRRRAARVPPTVAHEADHAPRSPRKWPAVRRATKQSAPVTSARASARRGRLAGVSRAATGVPSIARSSIAPIFTQFRVLWRRASPKPGYSTLWVSCETPSSREMAGAAPLQQSRRRGPRASWTRPSSPVNAAHRRAARRVPATGTRAASRSRRQRPKTLLHRHARARGGRGPRGRSAAAGAPRPRRSRTRALLRGRARRARARRARQGGAPRGVPGAVDRLGVARGGRARGRARRLEREGWVSDVGQAGDDGGAADAANLAKKASIAISNEYERGQGFQIGEGLYPYAFLAQIYTPTTPRGARAARRVRARVGVRLPGAAGAADAAAARRGAARRRARRRASAELRVTFTQLGAHVVTLLRTPSPLGGAATVVVEASRPSGTTTSTTPPSPRSAAATTT